MFSHDTYNVTTSLVLFLALQLAAPAAHAGAMPAGASPSDDLIKRVTFWGQPYPYGYAYAVRNEQCVERRKVETPNGWRWKTIRVCNEPLIVK